MTAIFRLNFQYYSRAIGVQLSKSTGWIRDVRKPQVEVSGMDSLVFISMCTKLIFIVEKDAMLKIIWPCKY